MLAAWTFAESARRPEMPTTLVAIALLGVSVAPLVMQPDFGQSVLLVLIAATMLGLQKAVVRGRNYQMESGKALAPLQLAGKHGFILSLALMGVIALSLPPA